MSMELCLIFVNSQTSSYDGTIHMDGYDDVGYDVRKANQRRSLAEESRTLRAQSAGIC